jgi:hypothetical protein
MMMGFKKLKFYKNACCPCHIPSLRHQNGGKCKFVSWDKRFVDPIAVPGRKPLVTLRDAATYITKLPKAEHDAEEWQRRCRRYCWSWNIADRRGARASVS